MSQLAFLLTFLLGLFSLRFLNKVTEQGDVEQKVVRQQLLTETFAAVRTVSTVPLLRYMVAGPASAASWLLGRRNGKNGNGEAESNGSGGVAAPPADADGGGEGG